MSRVLLSCAVLAGGMLLPGATPQCAETAASPAPSVQLARSEPLQVAPKKLEPRAESRAEAAIEAALKSTTQLEFIETPLQDVIDYLKDKHQIEIQLDKKAMEDAGIGTDTPVTKNLKNVTLRSALNMMLRELGLAWTIENEVLLITTAEREQETLATRVYDVADLVVCRDSKDKLWDDYEPLIELITTGVGDKSWGRRGGPASLAGGSVGTAKVLVVRAPREMQREVSELLEHIRATAAKKSSSELPRRDPVWATPLHRQEASGLLPGNVKPKEQTGDATKRGQPPGDDRPNPFDQ